MATEWKSLWGLNMKYRLAFGKLWSIVNDQNIKFIITFFNYTHLLYV